MSALFPEHGFDALEIDHPVFRAFYRYANVHYPAYDGRVERSTQGPPQLSR